MGGQAQETEGEARVQALQHQVLGKLTWLGSRKKQIPLHKFPLHEDVYSIHTVWLLHWKVCLDVIMGYSRLEGLRGEDPVGSGGLWQISPHPTNNFARGTEKCSRGF